MPRRKSKSKKSRSCRCKGQTISQKVIVGGLGGGGATSVYATYANPFHGSQPMLPPSFPTDLGGGFGGRDEAGRKPRDDLQYGSEPSFVSTRTKMSSASQMSTESVSPLHRWVFNDAQQNVPMGSYASSVAESVAESMSGSVVSPGSDASSIMSYRPPSLVESIKSVKSFKSKSVNRQTFDPTRYDSLGRAIPQPEDGEVQDVTPKPPVINLATSVSNKRVKPVTRPKFVDILNREYKDKKMRPTNPVTFDKPKSEFTPGPIVPVASTRPKRKAPQIKRPNESRGVKKIVSTKRMSFLESDLKTLVV
jgi:hypothetical protein